MIHGGPWTPASGCRRGRRTRARIEKRRTLAQAPAEEASAPVEGGREREKRRIREDFEVIAQRSQDVHNKRFWVLLVSPPSRYQHLR